MSASRDWISTEAAISTLLPGAGGPSVRAQLLARLADYSAAAIREARALGAIVPSTTECATALEWLRRPVLICGHQRSGTTLLQNLLDGHPQLLVLPSEGTYFTSFAYVARASPAERDIDRFAADWITRFVDPNFAPHFRLGRSDGSRNPAVEFARSLFGWCEALRSHAPPKLAPLLALAAAFRATTRTEETPHLWVEKTPQNERFAERFESLPEARFIQLVRDPRATLASLAEIYRTSGVGMFDAAEHARAIGLSLRLAITNPRRFRGRYIVVRYEDLIDAPARETELVSQFLGITSDATLLVPTASGRAAITNSSFVAGAAGVIVRPRATALSPDHLALLGVYAASAAQALGYELTGPPPIRRCALGLRHWPRHALRRLRAAARAVVRPLRGATRR